MPIAAQADMAQPFNYAVADWTQAGAAALRTLNDATRAVEEENSRNNLLAELYAKAEDLNTQLATICPLGWTTGPPKAGSLLFLQLLKQLELLSGMTENLQRSYQHYQAEYSEMTLQLNAMLAGRAAVYEHLEQEVNPVKVEPERT